MTGKVMFIVDRYNTINLLSWLNVGGNMDIAQAYLSNDKDMIKFQYGDHIIRFAIDVEGEGLVKATVCGQSITVRAQAIAWSCGPDGKFDGLDKMGRSDDIFSFREGQIVK